jgi:hypothetical protein
VELILAAISHASGSHQHSDIRIDPNRRVATLKGILPALYALPDRDEALS